MQLRWLTKKNKIIITCTSGEVSATASRSSTTGGGSGLSSKPGGTENLPSLAVDATGTTLFPVGPGLLASHCFAPTQELRKKLSGMWEVHPCIMWQSVGRRWGFAPCWFCSLFGELEVLNRKSKVKIRKMNHEAAFLEEQKKSVMQDWLKKLLLDHKELRDSGVSDSEIDLLLPLQL
jgi:hypothetical protein